MSVELGIRPKSQQAEFKYVPPDTSEIRKKRAASVLPDLLALRKKQEKFRYVPIAPSKAPERGITSVLPDLLAPSKPTQPEVSRITQDKQTVQNPGRRTIGVLQDAISTIKSSTTYETVLKSSEAVMRVLKEKTGEFKSYAVKQLDDYKSREGSGPSRLFETVQSQIKTLLKENKTKPIDTQDNLWGTSGASLPAGRQENIVPPVARIQSVQQGERISPPKDESRIEIPEPTVPEIPMVLESKAEAAPQDKVDPEVIIVEPIDLAPETEAPKPSFELDSSEPMALYEVKPFPKPAEKEKRKSIRKKLDELSQRRAEKKALTDRRSKLMRNVALAAGVAVAAVPIADRIDALVSSNRPVSAHHLTVEKAQQRYAMGLSSDSRAHVVFDAYNQKPIVTFPTAERKIVPKENKKPVLQVPVESAPVAEPAIVLQTLPAPEAAPVPAPLPSTEAGRMAKRILEHPNIYIAPAPDNNDRIRRSVEAIPETGKTFLYDVDNPVDTSVDPGVLRLVLELAKNGKDDNVGLEVIIESLSTSHGHAENSTHYNGHGIDLGFTSESDFKAAFAFLWVNREILGINELIYGGQLPEGTSNLVDGTAYNYSPQTLKAHGGHIHVSTK